MDQSLDEIINGNRPEARPDQKRRRGPRKGSRRGPARASDDRRREPSCVLIKNLHSSISEDDLRDLFREVGPIVRVSIDYNDRDRRTGRAWVLYDYGEDAAVAAGRFDGRKAVGQTITVKQVRRIGDLDVSAGSLRDRIGSRGDRNSRDRPAAREKKTKAKPRTEKKTAKTQEELDAELDAYMAGDVPAASSEAAAAPAAEAPAAAASEAPAAAAAPAPAQAPAEAPAAATTAGDDFMIE